jgi:alpha/beta superfamily hydrolase
MNTACCSRGDACIALGGASPAPTPTARAGVVASEVDTKAERLSIPGPVGRLEALLEFDAAWRVRATAVVCHPHPLFGGTLHNKVVYCAAKAALQTGLPTLRFNFRGVGKSEGQFADGIGEREDVRAALDFLRARYPQVPVCLMGFSFGSVVGLSVGARDAQVAALVGLGVPVGISSFDFLREAHKPILIVQGTEDIYGPREQIETLFSTLPEPKHLRWIEGADHFFTGKLDGVQSAVREFVEQVLMQIAPPPD